MTPFDTTIKEDPPDEEARKALIEMAVVAARKGEIRDAIEALYRSYYLDGLFKKLKAKWGKLTEDEVHDAIVQAVVQLIEKSVLGARILRPQAYIYKVANGVAHDIWKEAENIIDIDVNFLSLETGDGQDQIDDLEAMAVEALSIARSLLSKLGQENVQSVMEYIFDVTAKHVEDISNAEIGEALGLSPDVVRKSKSRGWRRLKERAADEGYHIDISFLKDRIDKNLGDNK